MLVSIAAYALIWGWPFAAGFVALLFLHELGHVIQLRREGVKASAPMFIPFLGAVISAKSMGDDAAAEARVGLAGPILGTHRDAGAARASGSPPAATSGGRSPTSASSSTSSTCCRCCRSTAAARWPRSAPGSGSSASPALVALAFFFPNPILFLVLVFGGMESWRRWKARNTPEGRAYHAIPDPHPGARRRHLSGAGGAARGRGRGDVPVAGDPELLAPFGRGYEGHRSPLDPGEAPLPPAAREVELG